MSHIQFENLPDSALLRERDILSVIPFSPATMWRRVKSGDFPQPIRMPGRMTCWQWGEVRAWLDAQAERRGSA